MRSGNDDKAGDERPGDTGNRGRHDCSHELCAASRMLEMCPPDYRKTFEACREESARLLDRMKTEKMDDEQFDKVFKEYCNRCNEMNAPMMEKYRLRERSSLFFRMLESKVIGLNRRSA